MQTICVPILHSNPRVVLRALTLRPRELWGLIWLPGVTIWHHFGTPDVIGGGRIPFTISERNRGRTSDEFGPL